MSKKTTKNSPFGALQGLRDRLVDEGKDKAEAQKKARMEELKKAAVAAAVEDDNELLARAMAGVKPMNAGGTKVVKKPNPPAATTNSGPVSGGAIVSSRSAAADDEEVLANLQDLVDERAPLEFTETDEVVEGRSRDCSHLDLSRLRDGDFAIQGSLDLHGHNRDEARKALLAFFDHSLKRGHRAVNVICGRGLHTPGGKPVIKDLLVSWLVAGRLSHNVLAFSSAKRQDGGAGAIYVLLRRIPKRV